MKRREFITLLGGASAPLLLAPFTARAQQRERVRRIGVLISLTQGDPESQGWMKAFAQRLQSLGWTPGRNIHVDYRWAGGARESTRIAAAELVAMAPEVIVADGTTTVLAVQRAAPTMPIVFVLVPDPVGAGIVPSLARPGGNLTGFTHYEYQTAGKWLDTLKEIAPGVSRALVLTRDPTTAPGSLALAAVEAAGRSLRVQVVSAPTSEAIDFERAINSFAAVPNGGLVVLPTVVTSIHRELIVALAARHRLPAVYPYRHFTEAGGLLSYSIDATEQFRQAASYVDRILRGEKPADLPVQAPVKYETVLNLKTAKALGLDVPASVLVRADEVIE